jgi:Zn ribbon nucleic-acid-binding protein
MPICTQCKSQFEHLPEDMKFYKEHSFPAPGLCPDCRHQHRCTFRNERFLYRGNCDLCGENMVTIFSDDKPFPVYCPECWWGNKWDGIRYGRDFDFSRPFFDQFFELRDQVPRLSLNNGNHVNSDYCNQCVGNKNCYLLFAADDNQDCMNSYWINRCADTYNSSWLVESTLCFDLVDSENCYRCIYGQDLKNCSNCHFSYDLIGCKNCFLCSGLRNKEYYINNKSYPREEYERKINSINPGSYAFYLEMKKLFLNIRTKIPHKYIHIINSENCTGDYIINSKNSKHCFDIFDSEDSRYAFNMVHQHFNDVDASYTTESRNSYQIMSVVGEDVNFSTIVWYSSNVWYSDLIQQSHNIFGCVGLRHKKNCILNKQYSKSDFEDLRGRIIKHMKRTGEWGKFFPVNKSPFAYNETVAQDFFPMTRNEVGSLGWHWQDMDKKDFQPQTYVIPDDIKSVGENICNEILSCSECRKNYKILLREFNFYKQVNYPIPRTCPDCRFLERLHMRNPRKLFDRKCDKCGAVIRTSYSPNRSEKVYCENCYLENIY